MSFKGKELEQFSFSATKCIVDVSSGPSDTAPV